MLPERPGDAARPTTLEERCHWLAHPAFIASVVVLALNDHLFKARFPGWWTGKLSDVAGLLVVGWLAAVLVGARRGPVVAGVGFLLLKSVPGVAELASPVLGGTTARDASDLVALAILLPLALCLYRASKKGRAGVEAPSARWKRARAGISAAMPLVWATLALVTATATSCGPSPAVTFVVADGAGLIALVDEGWGGNHWARSDDGGRTWLEIDRPEGVEAPSARGPFTDPGLTGPFQGCTDDGACWRLRDRRAIEMRRPGGDWVEEYRITDEEFDAISTGCQGGQVGVLSSLVVAEVNDEPVAVASFGADGVLRRDGNGSWTQTRVLSAPPVAASAIERTTALAMFWFGPVLAILMLLVGRTWWPSWRRGLVAIGIGWFSTISAAGVIGFWIGTDTDPLIALSRATIAGAVATTVAAIVVARRPSREGVGTRATVPERPDPH